MTQIHGEPSKLSSSDSDSVKSINAIGENSNSGGCDGNGSLNLFKPFYKRHRNLLREEVESIPGILDPLSHESYSGQYSLAIHRKQFSPSWINATRQFLGEEDVGGCSENWLQCIEINQLPGLQIITGLLSTAVQQRLVYDIITEYIPPKQHLSNLDLHYHLPRPLNIFEQDESRIIHKVPGKPFITMNNLRSKQLRWVTLGGQYNWTTKVYPSFIPGDEGFPPFPQRLADLLGSAFDIRAEAAIVNFYSPGDTLSPHQDVAELVNTDLISISLGCDCIFYVGRSRDSEPLSILLRSGDIVVMGGESRVAFHGVGKVWADTCPEFLVEGRNSQLYGPWVRNKRININVRQMLK